MTRIILAALLFLTANKTLADVKNKEKAKFDLISSIEVLVNIDECQKGIRSNEDGSVLPRACNSLPYLAKYFFDPKKDKSAINGYLHSEESKITSEALKIVRTYGITKLGKMILSSKCVKNKEPIDLDIYLKKIKGLPVPELEESVAHKMDKDLEKKDRNSLNDLQPISTEPRQPAKVADESKSAIEVEFDFENSD